jgi:putative transposase
MKKSKFSEAQIVYAIRENESGTKVAEITRRLGISQATFFTWKKKYGDMGVTELKRLRTLEDDENAQLKKLVADLSLDKQMLQDILKKKFEPLRSERPWPTTCKRLMPYHCVEVFVFPMCRLVCGITKKEIEEINGYACA